MDIDMRENLLSGLSGGTAAPAIPSAPALDAGDYLDDLADFDMGEAQKIKLLEILWEMMGSFARLGFSADVCGLIFEEFNEASAPESGNGRLIPSAHTETPSNEDGKEGTV